MNAPVVIAHELTALPGFSSAVLQEVLHPEWASARARIWSTRCDKSSPKLCSNRSVPAVTAALHVDLAGALASRPQVAVLVADHRRSNSFRRREKPIPSARGSSGVLCVKLTADLSDTSAGYG